MLRIKKRGGERAKSLAPTGPGRPEWRAMSAFFTLVVVT
jgi:hypothetical protein